MATQGAEPFPASVHPAESDLERFLRGELTRSEARTVVRHLLAGCESCRAVTRRLWRFGDGPGERRTGSDLEGGSSLMTDVEAAKAEIREILRELKPLKFRLLGVAASLPPAPAEISLLPDVEPADLRTEIRSVVECVVNDSFSPAIRDLDEVAGLGGGEPE
ncbi:MAG TPA: hypothetical protein VGM86_17505 [Thermoanaerobaculia bacterium]